MGGYGRSVGDHGRSVGDYARSVAGLGSLEGGHVRSLGGQWEVSGRSVGGQWGVSGKSVGGQERSVAGHARSLKIMELHSAHHH